MAVYFSAYAQLVQEIDTAGLQHVSVQNHCEWVSLAVYITPRQVYVHVVASFCADIDLCNLAAVAVLFAQ